LGNPLVNLLAGEHKRRAFNFEDDRPRCDRKLNAGEDPARLRISKELSAPFWARVFAQSDAPGWQSLTSAYVLRFADSVRHG
jgi:hypothetical protein